MKKVVFLLIAVLGVSTLFAQKPLEFKETKYTFGKIKQGTPVTHVFTFKNVSDKPVVIESAVAGCGCTTPEYNKGAIAKGASDQIKVTYNAAAMGAFTKQVTVKVAGEQEPVVLNIDGEVVDAAAAPATAAASDKTAPVAAKEKVKISTDKAKVKTKQ
jgi:arginase family enzyme